MVENAQRLGDRFRAGLAALNSPVLTAIRGRGLLNGVTIREGVSAWEVCLGLRDRGLLAKPTHGDKIRFAPPLVISEQQLDDALEIIGATLKAHE
mmetsp:Transcript_4047/g.10049  ORF Transcript_4047/g.10049 Transcript_4047/m.10049 type:complete len:95 (-) Transcript_4047:2563-2847(-)